MTIEPIFLYILIGSVFFLSTLLVVITWAQISLFKTLSQLKKRNYQLRASLIKQEGEIIERGRDEAKKIVNQALKRAIQIEKQAKVNQKDLNKLLEERLKNLSQNYVEKLSEVSQKTLVSYQKSLSYQLEINIKELNKISKDIKNNTIKTMYSEIEKYKQERIKELEQKLIQELPQLLRKISEEVLANSLRPEDHQELILQAIEKAISQGVI